MLTSSLTAGQLVKALSAFVGPLLAGYCSYHLGGWEMMFLIYAAITLLSTVWLYFVPISREDTIDGGSSIGATFVLLKDCRILVLFLGIICVVGLDVGMNTVIPKLLIERIGVGIEEAGYGTSAYFAARTLGAFLGVFILAKVSENSISPAICLLPYWLWLDLSWRILISVYCFLYVLLLFVQLVSSR